MNVAAVSALGKISDVHYSGPINPSPNVQQKVTSKLLRMTGSRGDYFFFSRRRLEKIAREVYERRADNAVLDFFHGFTPWVLTKPERPYIAWSDCTFRDYIDIFHHREQFRSADLERIERAEAHWLTKASRVLFTSHWAAERAVNDYKLNPSRTGCVGIFGEVDVPVCDHYRGSKEFVFASTDFDAKGGPAVLSAFRQARARHHEATLTIVGDPPTNAVHEPGVTFTGFLRKERPDEYLRFREALGRARALVNATRRDVSPLLIIEAAYFGCPAISPRRFAIPELVDDRRTGLLIDEPPHVDALADAMSWMLEHEEEYRVMRRAAWTKAREQHSKCRFEERLLSQVRDVMSAEGIPVA